MSCLTIVWFRNDLRLADHAALHAACARGAVIPVFIEDLAGEGDWPPGAAARWWLHHSLAALDEALRARGARLLIRRGAALAQLQALCSESGADAVYWQRRYEPAGIACDRHVKEQLRAAGSDAQSFPGGLLVEPWEIRNRSGKPFQVFTPFWRQLLEQYRPGPELPAPEHITTPVRWPAGMALEDLQLLPTVRWDAGLATSWQPGEQQAQRRITAFLDTGLAGYRDQRERPDRAGTSRLSPALHFGELSPRQIWLAVGRAQQRRGISAAAWREEKFLNEVVWREFSHHLLYHFPHTTQAPLREEFARFPWRDDPAALQAWQRGRTGIPLVDAGMRELWHTGWMHNRVRMVVASFLVKNLRLRWQLGARWFWDTLVDADLANNTQGWQWTSGCGADAAPYFRIFNPHAQAEKFDPEGAYVRRWVPELGTTAYPAPIVDLADSRREALEAFRSLRET